MQVQCAHSLRIRITKYGVVYTQCNPDVVWVGHMYTHMYILVTPPICSMSMCAVQLSNCKAALNSKWGNWVNFLSGGVMKGKVIISTIVYFC